MKTIQDYLYDHRITSDSGLMSSPEEIRTIHAIRLKQQDETAEMSFDEKIIFHKNKTDAVFASLGLPPPEYVDFSAHEKTRAMAAVGT